MNKKVKNVRLSSKKRLVTLSRRKRKVKEIKKQKILQANLRRALKKQKMLRASKRVSLKQKIRALKNKIQKIQFQSQSKRNYKNQNLREKIQKKANPPNQPKLQKLK